MSDTAGFGVLYTDHTGLTAMTPIASLWSYETRSRERDRRSITLNPDGRREYWLDRSDPLLNTILPGTGVSLIVNLGDLWAAGRSLATSGLLPRACVVGPVTQPRILRVGRSVCAIGAGFLSTLTPGIFGVPASELVDHIVPLQDLWTPADVDRLFASLACVEIRRSLSSLRDELMARVGRAKSHEAAGAAAPRMIEVIQHRGGRVSIDDLARSHALSRQEFARRFHAAAGLRPKLFARITRFQRLVRALLSTDVSRWASVSPALGFYDQAHMINEFRAFADSPPTVFFRPHGNTADPAGIQLRGRPSEWVCAPDPPLDLLLR